MKYHNKIDDSNSKFEGYQKKLISNITMGMMFMLFDKNVMM